MYGNDCDGDDGRKYSGEHDKDEPGSAVCGLRGGLSDAHGVDKDVRDELDELHVFWMRNWGDSSRNRHLPSLSAIAESDGFMVHLGLWCI